MFHPFLNEDVDMIGVEAAGLGLNTGKHAAPLNKGKPGILHGNRTYIMADDNGQIESTHSISAGLDYPGVGPEHSWLKNNNRVKYVSVTDKEALKAFHYLTEKEGIIPALETAHALAYAFKIAKKLNKKNILINLSGRGDKDIDTVALLNRIQV
jgi:tryptophan synthase beta chain